MEEPFLQQLSAAVASMGLISSDGGGSAVSLHAYDGRVFCFDTDLAGMRAAVERTDTSGLWPGTDDETPLTAKLRLFSVHLYEALETAPADAVHLSFRHYGIVAL